MAKIDLGEMADIMEKLTAKEKAVGDYIVRDIYLVAGDIYEEVTTVKSKGKRWSQRVDDLITSSFWGYPSMILLLAVVLWITIAGANVPSGMLADAFSFMEQKLTEWSLALNVPIWIQGIVVEGMFKTAGWVISVMLPPMAIFFPLFTLLEDLGYLPRVAFNLDKLFKKAGAHGKQSLTMCMGFGCNAAGVISTRIIDSPRERLIAIITNNFVPCNGRFPTLIAIATIFVGGLVSTQLSSFVATLFVTGLIIFGIAVTLIVSKLLTKTYLKGEASSFTLELPPFRKPKIGHIIYTSLIDRTIFVLGRAVVIAVPAGIVTWILANVYVGEMSLIAYLASVLEPIAFWIGLDGFILLAFILGLPANEIVIPILIMSYMSTGSMLELDSLTEMKQLFVNHGWTFLTALNVMLFSLLHFPCGTTLYTIQKETGKKRWTLLSALLPTVVAFGVCFVTAGIYRLIILLV